MSWGSRAALEASVRYLAHDLGAKGIRVNAISAGPIRTRAPGISGFKDMLHYVSERAPLKEISTPRKWVKPRSICAATGAALSPAK